MPAFHKTIETFKAGARTLPQQYFISEKVFALEQQRIFSTEWICLGHQSQVEKAGDYLIAEIGRESLVIVRDEASQLHGFYNVCRHRGTRLCEERQGRFTHTIQCPYHAWTYRLDGRLVGAPHMDEVAGFEKSNHSLQAVRLAVWEGLIFVNLAKDPVPFPNRYAPLEGKFSHWNLPHLQSARTIGYGVQANWKLIFQNYSECYHCPLVHPELSKLSPYDSAENDLFEGPFLGGFMAINRGSSLTLSGKACALPVGDIKAEDHQRVFYYSIFPNLLLSLHPDYVMVHRLEPRSPDRTLISCDWYFHPAAFGRADFNPADAVDFWDMTNRQDWHVCELSQQGIGSRAYEPGFYSPRESIPAAWDREYLNVMGEM